MHEVLVSIHRLPFLVYKHKKEIKDEQSLEVDVYRLLQQEFHEEKHCPHPFTEETSHEKGQ